MYAISLLETKTLSVNNGNYEAWSTVFRRQNGQLCLTFSGGRMRHICPFGRLEFMQSNDDGQTWSWPRVILDSAYDDRDGGIVETQSGTLIASTFSSDAYQQIYHAFDDEDVIRKMKLTQDDCVKWQQAHLRLTCAPESTTGQWVLRSTDHGASWSPPIPAIVTSAHGPICLKSGMLFHGGKDAWGGQGRIGASISVDDGITWSWLSEIPTRPGDDVKYYYELHAVEAENGTLIVHIRNWNENNQGETLQSESFDGGQTWTVPHSIGVWGIPSHLLKLSDGRLMMTYGYRRPPFGNQARFSADHGASWSEPVTISDDGTCTDLGYPSSVELADGRFLTIWYERKESAKRSVLRQCIWQLKP